MKLPRPLRSVICGVLLLAGRAAGEVQPKPSWNPATWNGERAYAAVAGNWKAIVSIERGRLIYFGAAGTDRNLLFAPPARDTGSGWGGHRVWCGPQALWAGGWPPPAAWEHSAAARVTVEDSHLVLAMPDSPDGWPRITREYYWSDGGLHCRVDVSGGRRDAQIIQIIQVPAAAEMTLRASRDKAAPRGYVQVHLGRHPSPRYIFPPVRQVVADGAGLRLKFTGAMEKLGFKPQTIQARIYGRDLTVARGASRGDATAEPDDGYMTQVYFGSTQAPLVELEQLSPVWRAGEDASFEMVLTVK